MDGSPVAEAKLGWFLTGLGLIFGALAVFGWVSHSDESSWPTAFLALAILSSAALALHRPRNLPRPVLWVTWGASLGAAFLTYN